MTDDPLKRAREIADNFAQSLPSTVDPRTTSHQSKVGFRVHLAREVLLFRVAELAGAACDHCEGGRNVAAATLTRAVIETVALLHRLDVKLEEAIQRGSVGSFADLSVQVLLGNRRPEGPAATSVITLVERLDKEFGGFMEAYAALSEIAHPNADGAVGSYSRPGADLTVALDALRFQLPATVVAGYLAGALQLFEEIYNGLPERIMAVTRLHEIELDRGTA